MTGFDVLVSQTAAKELKALEKGLQTRIKIKMRELAQDPSNRSGRLEVKKLLATKRDYYRLRVGSTELYFL